MFSGIRLFMKNRSPILGTLRCLSVRQACLVFLLLLLSVLICAAVHAKVPSTYTVKRGDTLSRIALAYRVSVEQLCRWNNISGHKILAGRQLVLWPDSRSTYYVVNSGDTLSEIALSTGVSLSSLRRLNQISNDRIYPGQKLNLQPDEGRESPPLIHVVRKGDTLWDVAQTYDLSVSELKEMNGLKTSGITPGMRLKVGEVSKKSESEDEPFEYVVKIGDSLSVIAQRFSVGLSLLRQLNHLKSDRIQPGQKLQLRPSSLEEAVHVVRAGENLSSIAMKYKMNLQDLVAINGIEGSKILVGQKLRLKTTPAHIHMVERGDSLWEIARAYGMTVKELKELNGLTADQIYPGQELRLGSKPPLTLDGYTVKQGDYLSRIARLHQMSVSELKQLNELSSSVIYPGQKLKVNPILRKSHEWSAMGEMRWDKFIKSIRGLQKIPAENGPYYGSSPTALLQGSASYYEGSSLSLSRSYHQAIKLWGAFDQAVGQMGRLSSDLKRWHFVLDPGHGGLDPGAVVEHVDDNGNSAYVVEDEYVYDVALRVYMMLRMHGAKVTMTLLSPNHLIRASNLIEHTFVNEKNEVYNSAGFNRGNSRSHWPNGGRNGNLSRRVKIAKRAFKGVPKKRRIFLSFHADIDHGSPEAPLVLYYENRRSRRVDVPSRKFSQAILSALGAGAHVRGQNLAVLRNNPAHVKVLLELRNLAYTDHAWALRFEELRQRDAEKVVQGILNYVGQSG